MSQEIRRWRPGKGRVMVASLTATVALASLSQSGGAAQVTKGSSETRSRQTDGLSPETIFAFGNIVLPRPPATTTLESPESKKNQVSEYVLGPQRNQSIQIIVTEMGSKVVANGNKGKLGKFSFVPLQNNPKTASDKSGWGWYGNMGDNTPRAAKAPGVIVLVYRDKSGKIDLSQGVPSLSVVDKKAHTMYSFDDSAQVSLLTAQNKPQNYPVTPVWTVGSTMLKDSANTSYSCGPQVCEIMETSALPTAVDAQGFDQAVLGQAADALGQ